MPKTKLGQWSLGLIIAFFLLWIIFQLLLASGQEGGATFFDNLWLSIPISLAGLAGILAFLTGLVSIVKSKERSPLVFISSLIGFFITIFILGEFLSPH